MFARIVNPSEKIHSKSIPLVEDATLIPEIVKSSSKREHQEKPFLSITKNRLKTIFDLTLAWEYPLNSDIWLMSMKILENLTLAHCLSFNDISECIFENEQFPQFFRAVSSRSIMPDEFVRTATLQTLDLLLKSSSYTVISKDEDLHQLYKRLTEMAGNLVLEPGTSYRFLLELLYSLCLKFPENNPDPVSDYLCNNLLHFLCQSKVENSLEARNWDLAFRIFKFANPELLKESPQLITILSRALSISEDLQMILQPDIATLLFHLLQNDTGEFQARITKILIAALKGQKQ